MFDRSRERTRRRLLVLLGLLAVAPLVLVDPVALGLLFDLELLALLGSAGLGLVRGDLRVMLARVRCAPSVVTFAAGIRLTRQDPWSVLAA